MTTEVPCLKRPKLDVAISGQPPIAFFGQARSKGFKAILNLRPATEQVGFNESEEVASAGLRYFSIPIATVQDLTRAAARALNEIVSDSENLPILVHCASGNRVGALLRYALCGNKESH
ncbi:fused DSP-PTPase phosphatase/NAD kinase-like protein [Robbsia andropogonis]|uniref:fused DSP-PTPase phosphatase/NAD kinase-like protein n=1 Tax=Robbsia andropogonis TaxID=28092 RepID=UPI00209F0A9F|nr:sulfur transferase domain-containing protein [Robbsia andropogonis]MCP1127283.1 sulfur transferase domain-containing protein [Robbsia andropogonis]